MVWPFVLQELQTKEATSNIETYLVLLADIFGQSVSLLWHKSFTVNN